MSLLALIFKEISHRKLSFLSGAFLSSFALLCLLVSIALLKSFDTETSAVLAKHEKETKQTSEAYHKQTAQILKKHEDHTRKNMKGLGFNILIYSGEQDINEVHDKGFASKTMPESYVHKLSETKTLTKINHLLPRLVKKFLWPEQKRPLILVGIRGEVPVAHRVLASPTGKAKKALIDPVDAGEAVLGYNMHSQLDLKIGDKITIKGKEFKISACNAERGTADDMTIWVNLKECQEMFKLSGQISSIHALNCDCSTLEIMAEVRAEISAILPGTKTLVRKNIALTRAKARKDATQTRIQGLAALKKKQIQDKLSITNSRNDLRRSTEDNALAIMCSITLLVIAAIAILTVSNIHQRNPEIGIYRAIGCNSGKILKLFLGRALICGLLGSGMALISTPIAIKIAAGSFHNMGPMELISAEQFAAILVAGPLIALFAAWLPCLQASRKDPAVILRQD